MAICERCGTEFVKRSSRHIYCAECKAIARKEAVRRYELKKYPNRKPRVPHYCVVCGKKSAGSFDGEYYCNKHWLRMYNNGTTELIGRKKKNTYNIEGSVAKCKTSNGREFLLDVEDVERCLEHSWCYDTRGYLAATLSGGNHATLHRFVLGLEDGDGSTVDHINGNRGDNRKSNLRLCAPAQNSRNLKKKRNNTSGYPGVRMAPSGKYVAQIMVNRKPINIGRYNTFAEAKEARIKAEEKYFGEFSPSLSRGVEKLEAGTV